MKLRLYKTPHIDVASPNKARLLFEGKVSQELATTEDRDFYLYVWVRDGQEFDSFQAVFGNRYVLSYHPTTGVVYGFISTRPIGRAIANGVPDGIEARMKLTVSQLECEHLPTLLSRVRDLVGGEETIDHRLAAEERRYVGELLSSVQPQ